METSTIVVKRWTSSNPIQAGELLYTWCGRCMVRTNHRYQPDALVKLQCIDCESDNKGNHNDTKA